MRLRRPTPEEAVRNRCRAILHECLDAAQMNHGAKHRGELVDQLEAQLSEAGYQASGFAPAQSYFEWARDTTYQFLSDHKDELNCSNHADYSYWLGEQRFQESLQAV